MRFAHYQLSFRARGADTLGALFGHCLRQIQVLHGTVPSFV